MSQEENLPINEPGLLGVAMPVEFPVEGSDEAPAIAPHLIEPETMQRRLWWMFPLVALGTSAISGGTNQALLAKLVASFPGGETVAAAASLGLALSISGITYLIAGPIGGILSDKTRTKFLGRRNLWVLIGAVATALSLFALGRADNITSLIVLASVATIPLSVVLAASGAVIPERVPLKARGRISSLQGMMGLIGAGIGIAEGSLAPSVFIGFVILAIQMLVLCVPFIFFTRDVPVAELIANEKSAGIVKASFPTPKSHPDYWWTFAARGLAFMAYGLAMGLELFALRDYFGLQTTEAASKVLPTITILSTSALAIAAVLGGFLVDRFGKLKPFVIASSLIFIPGALILALVPTVLGAFIGFTVVGLAFGSYISVDGVLMTRVIPNKRNAGRDLGLLNVSGSVGSVIAPVLAGALVAVTGYGFVFLLVILAGALASGCVAFIKSVK